MPLLAFVAAIYVLWLLATHLLRIFGGDAKLLNLIDAVLTIGALILVAVEAHKGGLF